MSSVGISCPACGHNDCPRPGITKKVMAFVWLIALPAWCVFTAGAFAIFGDIVGYIVSPAAGAFAAWMLSRRIEDTYKCPSCGKEFYVPFG